MPCVVTKHIKLSKILVKPGEDVTVTARFGNNCWLPQLFKMIVYLDEKEIKSLWWFLLPYLETEWSITIKAPKQTGMHTVRVVTNQEEDEGLTGKTATFVVYSEAPPENRGLLVVESDPSGAVVYINGKMVGYTPYSAWIPKGCYSVKVSLAGYISQSRRVCIKPYTSTKVRFKLKRAKRETGWLLPLGLGVVGVVVGTGLALQRKEEEHV